MTIALIAGGASLPALPAQAAAASRTAILDGAEVVSLKDAADRLADAG